MAGGDPDGAAALTHMPARAACDTPPAGENLAARRFRILSTATCSFRELYKRTPFADPTDRAPAAPLCFLPARFLPGGGGGDDVSGALSDSASVSGVEDEIVAL